MNNARQTIDELIALEPIKVWSLIITLFGDRGGRLPAALSGKEIRGLLEHIGIRPDTTRVALHRLKKEGWITTSKQGREVSYSLSETGLSETTSAYEDVYRRDIKYGAGWRLQLRLHESMCADNGGLSVFRHVMLVPNGVPDSSSDCMDVNFGTEVVPPWFMDLVVSPKHVAIAEGYVQVIAGMDPTVEHCTDLDRSALRLLVLHHWRKMALRDSTWFHIWMFKDGAFANCHRQVAELLVGSLHCDG